VLTIKTAASKAHSHRLFIVFLLRMLIRGIIAELFPHYKSYCAELLQVVTLFFLKKFGEYTQPAGINHNQHNRGFT
jgi:hypothetical protein